MFYVTRMTQRKNDSINLILQHGRVVENNFLCSISYFKTQMAGSYQVLSYKD